MDSQEFRRRGREVIDFIIEYHSTLHQRRIMHDKKRGYLKELLPDNAPAKPESFDKVMEDLKNYLLPGIIHWRHPRFFAYFPCGHSYPSTLADMLISAFNCAGFSWVAGPACTELEIITLDWLGQMIGLPEEFLTTSPRRSAGEPRGGGVFQVSSADATLVTMLAARFAKTKELNRRNPTLDRKVHLPFFMAYCSRICHDSIRKIAEVAMVQIRLLEPDEKHRLRGETLARAMKEDREKGVIPFLVYACLGTTATCSCDALEEIGPVCEEFGVWLHVDGAYAGSALICPEFRHLVRGVEYAQSFSIDPSMWMLMNFDCCAMWVQDRYMLTEALIISPLYLEHAFSHQAVDYRHWGVPLSRRFRALKLWFVVRSYGVEGLQKHIRKHVRLAKKFEYLVRSDERFKVEHEVHFGIVCFRLKGCDTQNVELLSSLNRSGKIFLVGTIFEGKYILRFCLCSEHTEEEDVDFAWELISSTATEILSRDDSDQVRPHDGASTPDS